MALELLPANRLPVNQVALAHLRPLPDWGVDPGRLYLLQLAEWAEQAEVQDNVLQPEVRHLLAGWLVNLSYLPPQEAMQFLTVDPDKASGPEDVLAQLEQRLREARSPEEAGSVILEELATRFQRIAPSLNRPALP